MNFLSEFKKVNISNIETLKSYIDFCLTNSGEKGDRHHILPRSLFPEYENLTEHPWNCAVLTPDKHYIAHAMLSVSLNEPSMDFAWYAMNNKNYNDPPIHLIGADAYAELIEKRNKSCSERMKNKVQALDTKTGKFVQVTKEEFDKTETLVGSTIGRGGEHLRNQVSVLIDGVAKRISKEDFDPNIHKHFRSKKATYKDKDGNLITCSTDDERVISGELVGINKNKELSKERREEISIQRKVLGLAKGSKNPRARKIEIYDNEDTLVAVCHGNFSEVCEEIGINATSLYNVLRNGKRLYDLKRTQTWAKNHGYEKFIGWYAIFAEN